MYTYHLTPKHDGHKSFYGKATVEEHSDGTTRLISYTTWVATIEDGKATVKGMYSATTTRHIKEFLQQHGFKADSTDQIVEDYIA